MNRTVLILITLITVLGLSGCNVFQSKTPELEGAMSKPRVGCFKCHDTLSNLVSEDHVKTDVSEVTGCLECHSKEGADAAFECAMHESHLTELDPEAVCDACHRIDGSGNFGLIGVRNRNTLPVTPEVVTGMQSYYMSWATSEYLDHNHGQRDVTCAGCHEKPFPEKRTAMDQCLGCHGNYEEVAALTKDLTHNPHDSHLGEIRCTLCHKGHEESVSYCTQCHEFDD